MTEESYKPISIRPDLEQFESYSAHTSPDFMRARYGLNMEDLIKVDANENPYGCSPRVVEALSKFRGYHIYPDSIQNELRQELSVYTSMSPERIVAGAGSDQLIDLVLRLMIEPGDEIIDLPPTFGMYPFYARLARARIINVKRDNNFAFSVEAINKHLSSKTRVVFVANPNNPSGNLISRTEIKTLLDTGILVVLDEAYYEFSHETVMPWLEKYDNLVVLRSFSKWAGLAGLRIGYGVFPVELAGHIMQIKDPYSVNVAGQVAALESLKDRDYLLGQVERIIVERERLYGELKSVCSIEPLPSTANFILCRVEDVSAHYLAEELKLRGVLVRYFNKPGLENYIRISIGRPEHNDILLDTIREILGEEGQ